MTERTTTPGFGASPVNQSAIEADINRTRNAISQDIRAIGERLSPENLKQEARQMAEHAKEAATEKAKEVAAQMKEAAVGKYREAKQKAVDTVSEKIEDVEWQARRAGDATMYFVRDNAIPLALIGVGMGWLIASRRSAARSEEWAPPRRRSRIASDEYRERVRYGMDTSANTADVGYTEGQSGFGERAESKLGEFRERAGEKFEHGRERARETLEHGRERARETFQHGRERARETLQHGRERARQFGERAQRRFHDLEERSRDFALDNPLAVGAMALAAGIGVALLLPSTEKENQLLGPARDRLVEGARQTAEEVGRTVKQTADDVKSSVSEQIHH